MKKWQKKAITEIMDGFNFLNVHRTMEALNWKWNGTLMPHVPNIDEIRDTALELLTNACQDRVDLASGGFCTIYDRKNKWIELSFVIEDFSVSKDELISKI